MRLAIRNQLTGTALVESTEVVLGVEQLDTAQRGPALERADPR